MRSHYWLAVAIVAISAGCNPKAPASSAPTTSSPVAQAGTGSSAGEPESPAATPETPENPASTAKPADDAQGTSATENPTPPAGEAQPATDPWLEGIENPQLTSAYAQMRQRLKDDPKDVDAHLNVIFILQNVGRMRSQMGDAGKAYATFAASAAEARSLVASGNEIPEAAGTLLSTVFYNDACALGRVKKTDEALKVLDEAVKWGFNDFAMLRSDEDLAALRELAEFEAKIAEWELAAAEALKKAAVEELASFESFPFDFEVTDVDGAPHKLADYKGKVVIVDFWGTWCPPCRAELPSFIKLQKTYGEQGFQMIGLNYEGKTDEETALKVKTFMTENGINYPCALGSEPTRAQVPNFEGYPTTLFIDRAGKVRMLAVGLHEYAYLEALVTALLNESGS